MAGITEGRVNAVVLGSIVFDLAVQVGRMPATHETVLAEGVTIGGGGKGLCQAIGAKRLGADVDLVGLVGDDVFGDYLLRLMADEGIDARHVGRDSAGTHLGIPMVTPDGKNRIIGVPRASWRVTAAQVDTAAEALRTPALLLLQGETPLDACRRALEVVGDAAIVVWNPAPATFTLTEMLNGPGRRVNWITPNEAEATVLTGITVTDRETAFTAATSIRTAYPHVGVVVTLGDRGAIAIDTSGHRHVAEAFPVTAVDTTAAGDTFTAAFGVSLAAGGELETALRFASVAGALSVTKVGAAASIPTATDVHEIIARA